MTDDMPPGMPATSRRRRGEIPWDEIRQLFEATDIAVTAIAATYGLRTPDIYAHARRHGWRLRRDQPHGKRVRRIDREALVMRMLQAVERQIAEIDRRFSPVDGSEPPQPDEKDARTLATLARTLELLIGLGKANAPRRRDDEPKGDMDELRRELARRIEGLRQR